MAALKQAAHRVALVACVKSKRKTAHRAADLYQSALFLGLSRYAKANADSWYILSAQHHLLDPSAVIEPYEKSLNSMKAYERVEWGRHVQRQLEQVLQPGVEVILLAGARYREHIEPFLVERGLKVSVPLRGLGIGRQLAWLRKELARR